MKESKSKKKVALHSVEEEILQLLVTEAFMFRF